VGGEGLRAERVRRKIHLPVPVPRMTHVSLTSCPPTVRSLSRERPDGKPGASEGCDDSGVAGRAEDSEAAEGGCREDASGPSSPASQPAQTTRPTQERLGKAEYSAMAAAIHSVLLPRYGVAPDPEYDPEEVSGRREDGWAREVEGWVGWVGGWVGGQGHRLISEWGRLFSASPSLPFCSF
jgi:hypothetical protein